MRSNKFNLWRIIVPNSARFDKMQFKCFLTGNMILSIRTNMADYSYAYVNEAWNAIWKPLKYDTEMKKNMKWPQQRGRYRF